MSVLFADLVGFTPFAEERDPEAVRELLSRYFDTAREVVERHGGAIEKFIGDAVMAVWGAPVAHEDDAERAVRAGLELVDSVRGLAAGIEARAGVLTGEAAVSLGAVGQGMVAGDLVNTAARLQSAAPPGSVLVGEATMRAASASIVFEAAGEQQLKGKGAPVAAWQALRVIAQRGGRGRAETLEPPFVGREEELRLLKELLHATGREGRARLVSITGPAGIGKSRLAWEFEKYIDGIVENVFWHRGRSPSYGEGITFWALGEMVRRRAGLAENDDEATTRSRIAATVAENVDDEADRRWVEPALLTLLGLEPSPAGGRDVLFAAWRIFFEHVARRGPTVLLFEDLQWADSGLLDFIDHQIEWSRGAPILVITLARPELFDRRPDWGAGVRQFTAIGLEPLSEPQMRELLSGLIPDVPDPVVRSILARADGMPLYAVEIVRSLITDGQLERAGDVYRAVGDLGELIVPETLRSLIASRLDALEPADRSLLQDASVVGQAFTIGNLSAVNGLTHVELEPRLRGLVRREILELEADPRSPERGQYLFVQSLIREVAYGTLARRDRRSRHLAIARHFEAAGDEETAGALASHYLAAHNASAEGEEATTVAAQARIALKAAAERAASLGAHEQAVSFAEQALSVTSEPAERGALFLSAATSAGIAARHDTALGYARAAIDASRLTGDPLAIARSSAAMGTAMLHASQVADAIPFLEGALDEFAAHIETDDDRDVEAQLLIELSRALMRDGNHRRVLDVTDRALAWAERRDLSALVVDGFNNRAVALLGIDRRRESAAIMEAAVRMAETDGLIDAQIRAMNNLSIVSIEDGPRRAREIARAACQLAVRVGNRMMANWTTGSSAWLALALGDDWDAELEALDAILAAATSPDAESDRLRALGLGAVLRAHRGEDLRDTLRDLESLQPSAGDRAMAQQVANVRAEVLEAEGLLQEAYDEYLRAADLFPPYGSALIESAGRVARRLGDVERAKSAAARLDAAPGAGAKSTAGRALAHAGIAALEGDRAEALLGFRDAVSRYRVLTAHFEVARAILDAIELMPDEPEVRGWADEARGIFERLRATPYLERLEAPLSPRAPDLGARRDASARAVVTAEVTPEVVVPQST